MRPGQAVMCAGVTFALAACATQTAAGDAFERAAHAIEPSVVLFTMRIPAADPKRKGAFDDAYGSGVVVASGAWGAQILTVAHVVQDATHLRAKLGARSAPAMVVAHDDDADLALVEANLPGAKVAALGTAAHAVSGAPVGVAGFPVPDAFSDEGLRTAVSVFSGRIAAVLNDSLELDLPVIPGESGAPVFDPSDATVIGLAESRFDDEHAIGFAIPIDDALPFLHGRLRT